jgi:hypothetical protein
MKIMKLKTRIGAVLCLLMGMLMMTPSQLVAQNGSSYLPVNRIPFYPTSGTTPEPVYTPCGSDAVKLANGAYEAIDPTASFSITDASATNIMASTYFKKLGNDLCVKIMSDASATWTNALNTCTGDWRLPNLAELAALNKTGNAVFTTTYSMHQSRQYWSTTLTTQNNHWYFRFDTNSNANGNGVWHSGTADSNVTDTYARCVRTGSQSN